jgi:hypothetical protein
MRTAVRCAAMLALAAACAPSCAARSGPVPGALERRGLLLLSVRPLAAVEPGPAASVSTLLLTTGPLRGDSGKPPAQSDSKLPHPRWTLSWDDHLLVRPCSLEALDPPETAPPPPAPPVYLSLGGPSPSLTPLDDLPRLRDETRLEDPDDALRLIRSRW